MIINKMEKFITTILAIVGIINNGMATESVTPSIFDQVPRYRFHYYARGEATSETLSDKPSTIIPNYPHYNKYGYPAIIRQDFTKELQQSNGTKIRPNDILYNSTEAQSNDVEDSKSLTYNDDGKTQQKALFLLTNLSPLISTTAPEDVIKATTSSSPIMSILNRYNVKNTVQQMDSLKQSLSINQIFPSTKPQFPPRDENRNTLTTSSSNDYSPTAESAPICTDCMLSPPINYNQVKPQPFSCPLHGNGLAFYNPMDFRVPPVSYVFVPQQIKRNQMV